MGIKKILAGISAVALLGSTILTFPFSAMAEAGDLHTADDAVEWMKKGIYLMTTMTLPDNEPFKYTETGAYTVKNPSVVPTAPEQEKFDLRDVDGKNYVSPVKNQSPYGTCWAFATVSAAEASFAYEGGIDWNTAPEDELKMADFSERHLAYFSGTPLTDNPQYPSQNGEGKVRYRAEQIKDSEDYTPEKFNGAYFNTGGFPAYASTLFSALIGPAPEIIAPYQNDENISRGAVIVVEIVKEPEAPIESIENLENYVADKNSIEYSYYYSEEELDELLDGALGELNLNTTDWYKGNGKYYFGKRPMGPSPEGTWTLDESLRFATVSELECSHILPALATTDENGAYVLSEAGLNAIKQELVNGRAVSIAYQADQSAPGDPVKTDSVMNFLDEDGNPTGDPEKAAYWCQYTFDTSYDPTNPESINHIVSPANHAVTIVGYDDTIPKEYFLDPNGTIGGDGAFIVKNSWGTKELDGTGWGNNGSGYFYLSYYDQSIKMAESFDFRVLTDERVQKEKYSAVDMEMYDLMPTNTMNEMSFESKASMANVFTAKDDCAIRSVGYTAVSCNENVSYDIYILNDNAKTPTDGVLAGHAEGSYLYAGYQRTDLETPIAVRKGQKYSIVVTAKREDGNYGVSIRADMTKQYYDDLFAYYDQMIETAQDEKTRNDFEKQRQSRMEGATYSQSVINPGESYLLADNTWTDWTDITAEVKNSEVGNYWTFDNFSIKSYSDCEIINVVNEIKEPAKTYQAGDVVEGQVTVRNKVQSEMNDFTFQLNGDDWTTVDSIAADESIVLPYQYTVTEEDVKNGFFTTEVNAFLTQADKTAELNLIDGFSTTKVTVKLDSSQETQETTEPEKTTEPAETETETETETDAQTETETETQASYTSERLCEMALKDYEVRTGVIPATAESSAAKDGKIVITLKDKDGKVLDTYTLDEKTALGKSSTGEDINLPQTGNQDASTAAAAAAAAGLTIAGVFLTVKSLRKKEQ